MSTRASRWKISHFNSVNQDDSVPRVRVRVNKWGRALHRRAVARRGAWVRAHADVPVRPLRDVDVVHHRYQRLRRFRRAHCLVRA